MRFEAREAALVLIDLSKGRYATDESGTVTGVVDTT